FGRRGPLTPANRCSSPWSWRSCHVRTVEKRREPVVFRARRAHARSRGPQIWVVTRQVAAHEGVYLWPPDTNDAPSSGNLKPLPPAVRTPLDRRGPTPDRWPRRLVARPPRTSPGRHLVRSWPPGRRYQVTGVCLSVSTTSRGVLTS